MQYFDWASTSPVSSEALVEYGKTSLLFPGNPSSLHSAGAEAKKYLEQCRTRLASVLKTNPGSVFFTSGGTESNHIAIHSLLNSSSSGEIIISSIEHSSVSETRTVLKSHGWTVTVLNCPGGYLSPQTLGSALNPDVRMVCVMKVNNVTGTVQDIPGLVSTVREFEKKTSRKIYFHCDAVQAVGKIPFFPDEEGPDSFSLSAHKFNGPRGTGVLWTKNPSFIRSLSQAGGQEHGIRGGTENLPAIASMTLALEKAVSNLENSAETVKQYRKTVEQCLDECGLKLLSPASGSSLSYSPYILLFSAGRIPSEVFVRVMSDKGYCLSSGSACNSNNRAKAEKILESMSINETYRTGAIRVSFSCMNTEEEVEGLCNAIKETVCELKDAI